MLNYPVKSNDFIDLLNYKRILQFKYINPEYAENFSVESIVSRVKLLTKGCVSKCVPDVECTTITTTAQGLPN